MFNNLKFQHVMVKLFVWILQHLTKITPQRNDFGTRVSAIILHGVHIGHWLNDFGFNIIFVLTNVIFYFNK